MKLSLKAAAATTAAVLAAGGVATAATAPSAQSAGSGLTFHLIRSAGAVAAGCLDDARATVHVKHAGQVEIMTIDAHNLPKRTGFDVFINQLPNAPFGVSWYQGDLHSDKHGDAHVTFIGRFSVETFAVAPGSGAAPVVHHDPIADATTNPAFAPVHTYHVGVWFNSLQKAIDAGCATDTTLPTPFNGDHNAGPQALSTRQFDDRHGPLRQFKP
ncbi:MAG TPA: hypothetical protein VE442_15330 [Jatrophihabitans sp.]|jgi:hypothetical protein|nr:hypothetical protein [Jatrophihabitans sp.]